MFIKVCPRCGSDDIVWIIPQNWSMWECNNCDYTGAVIEVEEDVQMEMVKYWREHREDILENKVCVDDCDDLCDEEFDKRLDDLFED